MTKTTAKIYDSSSPKRTCIANDEAIDRTEQHSATSSNHAEQLKVHLKSNDLCLIVNGVPESTADDNAKRIDDGRSFLKDLFYNVLDKGEEIEMDRTIRLGKAFNADKPRPIRVSLKSTEQRNTLISNSRKLKVLAPGFFFHKHYSALERALYRKKKEEMKELIAKTKKIM